MDRFNIISLTDNLDELEADMEKWSNLPYDIRLKSNEDCYRLYNLSVVDLYHKLKSSVIFNQVSPNDTYEDIIGIIKTESTMEYYNSDIDKRKEIVDQLELSPEIVLISPEKDVANISMEDIVLKYNKYLLLNNKSRRFSDYYSILLYGNTVPSMFQIIINQLKNDDLENQSKGFETIEDVLQKSTIYKTDNFLSNILETVDKRVIEDDKIGLYLTKLDSLFDMDLYSKTIYESIISNIDQCLYHTNYNDTLPMVTPYFTPDELDTLTYINGCGNISKDEYYKLISMKMDQYEKSAGEEKEQMANELISIGWNPSVKINKENLEFARNRQIRWLKEHSVKIIDLTKLNTDSSLLESSDITKLCKQKDIYPIFIVISYSDTLFGNIINKVKNTLYSHAGLSMDSNLNKICTFKWGTKFNGFHVESIDTYIKNSKDAIIDVLTVFVDKNTKNKVEIILKDFISKQDKTKYGFGNLFNILANKEINDPENLSLVCSQFVDTVLKLANINLIDKPSNLVIPQDFETINTHPKVYKVYEGKAVDYRSSKVNDILCSLLNTHYIKDLRFSDVLKTVSEQYSIESFYYNTESVKANKILEEIRELLNPQAIIYEKKLPFKITDNGDLSINVMKTLEQQYQESHKILSGYTEENLDGIKNELSRLFMINSIIEKKIKKMKKDDSSYKPLIDLRARVLNDFKKYFKVVMNQEPTFDFAKYFENSDYNNGTIVIDNSTLKFSGNLIKKFLRSKGI